ncbi:unnamed protein product [Calicophoron daubneyi]|uniref:Uncharacterized protein n=1 Tax=Calicophoron daubneyi TaxID=300641 RepID=A0AAV2T0M7_CALDB
MPRKLKSRDRVTPLPDCRKDRGKNEDVRRFRKFSLPAEISVPVNVRPKRTRFKHTKFRDRLLPIPALQLNQYLDAEWTSIKRRLCRVLSAGDLIYELPEVFGSIQSFVHCNGMRIPKSDRVALLRLTLSLVCCPCLDPMVSFWSMNLAKVLMKRLWTLPVGTLELNWRDFHEMIQWLTITPEYSLNLLQWPRREMDNLLTVIRLCRKFFPLSCIEEIWREFRHQTLDSMLHTQGQSAFEMLRLLVPFCPKSFDAISQTFLQDIFDMWYLIPDYGKPFHDTIGLFAQLSRYCRGRIDWEPHMERIFCGLIRAVTLPQGPVSMVDTHGSPVKLSTLDPYAVLLINAVGPHRSDRPCTVISRLQQFYTAVEPFYHPSNPCVSTTILISFTHHLICVLTHRLRDELLQYSHQSDDLGLSPTEFDLTVEQVDQLVNLLLPVTMDYMLFCKIDRSLIKVAKSIFLLARLRPRIVLPKLLNLLEDGLSRPEAPLRYTRPLYALVFCMPSFSFVRFPLYQRGTRARYGVIADAQEDERIDEEEYEEEDEETDMTGTVVNAEEVDGVITEGFISDVEHMNLEVSTPKMERKAHGSARMKRRASVPVVPAIRQHLEAFAYPEGRTEHVKLLSILLSGLDLNRSDRIYLTIACLSRLFLSTPIQDYSDLDLGSLIDCTEEHVASIISASADIEETVVRVFQRILECIISLNDRSTVAQNVSSSGPSISTNLADGSTLSRPHAGPEGRPRVASEICLLSALTGLGVALAISTGPVPRLRCRLLTMLTDTVFDAQLEPDTARLLAYQTFWLAVNSKCSAASLMQCAMEDEQPPNTSLFALELIWPRFKSVYEEADKDQSIIYRGKADPRLLSLLYVLAGHLSAVPPQNLIESGFRSRFVDPLISVLSNLLSLSTGGAVQVCDESTTQQEQFSHAVNKTDQFGDGCPALAEASASLLAILLHRLSSYSVDFTSLDLMQTGSYGSPPDCLFITSPWWTPFLSLHSLFNQAKGTSKRKDPTLALKECSHKDSDTILWFRPTSETRALADQLVHRFFTPILQRLQELNAEINRVLTSNNPNGRVSFIPNWSRQRNQLSSILIWANHIFNGLGDSLAPRAFDGVADEVPPWHGHMGLVSTDDTVPVPQSSTQSNQGKTIGRTKLPMLSFSFLDCTLPDTEGQSTNLRDLVFRVGLKLLSTIAEFFKRVDDSLTSLSDSLENGGEADPSEKRSKSADSSGLMFTCGQIEDLLTLTQRAAFNWATNEHPPCLLQTVKGPQALCGPDLGARSCLAPLGNSNTLDLIPFVKLLPPIEDLFGTCTVPNRNSYPLRSGCDLRDRHVGHSAVAWLATLYNRYWWLLAYRLRSPLTLAAAKSNDECLVSKYILPTPRIRDLLHTICVLATAPRRTDIRKCASTSLTKFPLALVPQATVDAVTMLTDRLENAESDLTTQSLAMPAEQLPKDPESKFKLIDHRRKSAVQLLSDIFHKINSMRQHDEFVRLDPTVMSRMWSALAAHALHRTSQKESGECVLSAEEIHHRQTCEDQLETLVFGAFGRLSKFPMHFIFSYPTSRDQIPPSSWLARAYEEAQRTVEVLNPDGYAVPSLCTSISKSVARIMNKRRATYKTFMSELYERCFSTCSLALIDSSRNKASADQALIARLFSLIPRPLDPPLTPSWKPGRTMLGPPPPPPPLGLIALAFNLITSQQPEVAQAACTFVTDILFLLLLRHRMPPFVKLNPSATALARTGHAVPEFSPAIPSPRADNEFLMFDENSRILSSDEAFEQHHHIPSINTGYIYYPPAVYREDPTYQIPYPVFSPTTGELDPAESQWLQHLDASSEEGRIGRDCLTFLATKLASPREETRKFWLLLADRLLHLHRAPTKKELFPLSLFIQACCKSFGPNPLVHHIEAFLRSLMIVLPENSAKLDGITELIGPCWVALGTLGTTEVARKWPRSWRYYYFGRVLPRILALSEITALTVSTSGISQILEGRLHPQLARLLSTPMQYAGNYGGAGSCHIDSKSKGIQNLTSFDHRMNGKSYTESFIDPLATVSQSQAGGPIHRLAFAWDLVFSWLFEDSDLDVDILHPIWDWAKMGIAESHKEWLKRQSSERVSLTVEDCEHHMDIPLPSKSIQPVNNECPVCLLRQNLPLAHRRVFYARLGAAFITYIGWKGLKLSPYLSALLPAEMPPNEDSLSSPSATSPWFQLASNDSVWIRDLAAQIAVFRACISYTDVYHGRRVPFRYLTYPSGSEELPYDPSSLAYVHESERFLQNLVCQPHDMELIGDEFLSKTFLPHLIRDTLDVLRLKGYTPSTASLALQSASPEANFENITSIQQQQGDSVSSKNGSSDSQQTKRIEWIPLTNRLRCMYACLPNLLCSAFPVFLRPVDEGQTTQKPLCHFSAVSLLKFCKILMPILADVCSVSDFYRKVACSLSMGAFGSAGFARASDDATGDDSLDGLESGVNLLIRQLAVLNLAGQGDPEAGVTACLDLTQPFLNHSSWKSRGIGLMLLRNLVMVNLPAFWELVDRFSSETEEDKKSTSSPPTDGSINRLRTVVTSYLADQWIEVRQLAMCTLAVFIQVGLFKFANSWASKLIKQARTPYLHKSGPLAADETAVYHRSIRERHAGVLGLAAFVCANPHTTPDYLPAIISELADHVHDPHPIQKTVSDTLSSYSRSHQDAWHEQCGKFTEEQLEAYRSVVSAAAYYV